MTPSSLAEAASRADPAALGGAPTVGILAELPAAWIGGIEAAAGLLGASVHVAVAPTPSEAGHAAWLLGARAVTRLGEDGAAALADAVRGLPVLLFPEQADDGGSLSDACRLLGLEVASVCPPDGLAGYRFSSADRLLRPFTGEQLVESTPRVLCTIAPGVGAESLIEASAGAVLARLRNQSVWVTTQPPLEGFVSGMQLRWMFHTARFLELLPLMLFMRHALGRSGWQAPEPRAGFMIDDPNLRTSRYGFVDYRQLSDAGARHGFHTIVAVSPLDLRKTGRRAADLFRRAPGELSLAMHGVHHSRHEFAHHVEEPHAVQRLAAGWRWAERHAARTRVPCAPVMTLPYERVNRDWLNAMRTAGLMGAIATTSFAFIDQTVLRASHDMFPAETGHRGFPIVTRFPLNVPAGNLLFQSFLGKPLILYGHHEDYRHGLEPFIAIADYLNRCIRPEWSGAERIMAGNFQVRADADRLDLRAFSNRIEVPKDLAEQVRAIWKHGARRFADEQTWIEPEDGGSLTAVFGVRRDPLRLARPALHPPGAYVRRLVTEARDRSLPRRSAGSRRAR